MSLWAGYISITSIVGRDLIAKTYSRNWCTWHVFFSIHKTTVSSHSSGCKNCALPDFFPRQARISTLLITVLAIFLIPSYTREICAQSRSALENNRLRFILSLNDVLRVFFNKMETLWKNYRFFYTRYLKIEKKYKKFGRLESKNIPIRSRYVCKK